MSANRYIFGLGGLAWKNRRLGCVGIPLPDVDVQIVDPESLAVLPNDTDGEVSPQQFIRMKHFTKCIL